MLGLIEANGFRAALAVSFFTFLLRFLYSALTLSGNALTYFWSFGGWGEIAGNVVAGEGMAHSALLGYFDLHEPRLTAARSPLPILLDATLIRMFGDTAAPIYVMQALLEAATTALIVFAGKSMARRYIYGILAGLLYMGFFPAIHYSRTMGSEPLAAFLTSLLVLNLIFCVRYPKSSQFLALGTLLGALTLTRPIYVIYLVPFVFCFAIANRKRGIRFPFLILLSFTITVLPWALRNYAVFGTPIITSTLAGYNLYRHNEPLNRGTYLEEGQQKHDLTLIKIKNVLRERGIAYEDLNEAQFDRLLKQEAMEIIMAHKVRYFRLSLERALWLFSSNGRETRAEVLMVMVLIFVSAAYGLYLYTKQYGYFEALLPGVVVILWIFVHSLLVAQLRYLIPIMPVACFFVAFGFIHLAEKRLSAGTEVVSALPGRYSQMVTLWRLL
jgi:4-amino-4-deoxy-L-arabinose transferase-like glycosyltransferase